ncbi:F-box/LRR-repeat protein At2g43260-like [Apium graveolens]|uniref:F-box/LRR-repeat protein At2g43260-like n=1 Tax=Apium graveolens TaxID=4045 RepID=UPI003D7A8410
MNMMIIACICSISMRLNLRLSSVSLTPKSKLVPPHNIRNNLKLLAMGFGFDHVSGDFKVVRVVASYDQPFSAEVYSANADVWRKIDPRPTDFPDCDEFDVCVNGFLCCEGLYGMMVFDLDKEVFTCGIDPLPSRSFNSTFINFNDSIAIITSTGYKLNAYNLWTLDDEACLRGSGVEASWTLKLSIGVDCAVDYPPRVYGCFNSGDFLICAGSGSYLLKNSHTEKTRNVPLANITGRRLIKYNESLVSITGSNQVHQNAREND